MQSILFVGPVLVPLLDPSLQKKISGKLLKSQEHIGPQDLNPMVEHGHQPITPFTRPLVFFTTGWLMRWLVVKVMSPCSFCSAGYLQSASFHPELLSNLFKNGVLPGTSPFFCKTISEKCSSKQHAILGRLFVLEVPIVERGCHHLNVSLL